MRHSSTFTQDELDQKYLLLKYEKEGPHVYNRELWGKPAQFSLKEARDILNFSETMLNKLRALKPGVSLKCSNAVHIYNNWGVVRVDEQLESQIASTQSNLDLVNAQIKSLTINLESQKKQLRKTLDSLEKQRIK